jgi:enoyl-CoA hydratase/carnithine racemase
MSQTSLPLHAEQCVVTLTLGCPQGAWTVDYVEALDQALNAIGANPEWRVLVLRGDWSQGLAAADWAEKMQTDRVRVHRALQSLQRWRSRVLPTLPQAVLALIDGPCAGAALALVEGSDLALASETSRFELSAHDGRWLSPAVEADFEAPDAVAASSMLSVLSGTAQSAQQAQNRGWITFSLPPGLLASRADELVASLAEKDPLALRFTKETLAYAPKMSWDASVNYTAAKFAEIKALQAQAGGASSRANAIAGFLAGQSKPGLKG